MTTLEERFATALHCTARAWKGAIGRRLKYLGLSQAGWTTIATVAKGAEPLSQIELAHHLGIEAPTMVAMIDRLVKLKLVSREPSTHDRRVKLVMLTGAGAALYRKVRAEADVFRSELLGDADPQRLLVATELLEHLQVVAEAAI